MPEKETLERAEADKQEGKSPSTQAGEFVREEIEHVREGKHGARSAKQAIAIGYLRRAGQALICRRRKADRVRYENRPLAILGKERRKAERSRQNAPRLRSAP